MVYPNLPYHVVQRGNNAQAVFRDDDDRKVYLALLHRQSRRYGLDLHAYCLMGNHVHLIVTPHIPDSLANGIGRTHFTYTRFWNKKYESTGHLWQNRFFSSLLDETHFWRAMIYVERNPVRAGMVDFAWEFPWSSAKAHVDGTDHAGLLDLDHWHRISTGLNWRSSLMKETDAVCNPAFVRSLRFGRPLVDDDFLDQLKLHAPTARRPRRKN